MECIPPKFILRAVGFMRKSIIILFVNFLCSLLHALFIPAFSLVLFKKYDLDSAQISLFFMSLAIASIVLSQTMGKVSDNGFSRTLLICLGFLGGFGGCLTFAITSDKWIDASLGVFLFSLTFVSLSQLIAYTRNFSDCVMSGEQSIRFNIIARAISALAWVLGPALGFFIFEFYGYQKLLYLVAFGYLSLALVIKIYLPNLEQIKSSDSNAERNTGLSSVFNLKTILSIFVFSMVFSCNQSYMISLPLYLNESFSLSERYAGILLASSAAIEVGIMLAISSLIRKFSIYFLLNASLVSAVVLYAGFWLASDFFALLALQIFNAIYIGIAISLGAIWFQNMLPRDAGSASAFFTNSINVGIIFGAIIVGSSGLFNGYRDVYLFNTIIMLCATIIFLLFCRDDEVLTNRDAAPKGAL